MDYDSMTVLELKSLCKDRGLRVSGKKAEVVIRLMEFDEAVNPQPSQQVFQQRAPMGYAAQQPMPVHYQQGPIYVKKESELASTIGICIILYGIFRLFWAVIFSVGTGGGMGWALSPVAFLLGLGFIVGGVITYSGYRNGIYLTLGVLAISGFMSLVFHADDWNDVNPVSIAWGEAMLMTSVMCSISCMIMVALPLLISTLKSGWPEPIENILRQNNNSDGKTQVKCQSCETTLQIPSGYSGSIECPSCKSQMNV